MSVYPNRTAAQSPSQRHPLHWSRPIPSCMLQSMSFTPVETNQRISPHSFWIAFSYRSCKSSRHYDVRAPHRNTVFDDSAWIAHNGASVPVIVTGGIVGTSYPLLNDAEAGLSLRLSLLSHSRPARYLVHVHVLTSRSPCRIRGGGGSVGEQRPHCTGPVHD